VEVVCWIVADGHRLALCVAETVTIQRDSYGLKEKMKRDG
jgi:hypothetical protein